MKLWGKPNLSEKFTWTTAGNDKRGGQNLPGRKYLRLTD
jgi:hypothetical protein